MVWIPAFALMVSQTAHAFQVPDQRPIDEKLFAAIQKGDEPRVRDLLAKGADPNANQANGWRPLLTLDLRAPTAVASAKDLVAKGAHVNYVQPAQGWTALDKAAQVGSLPMVSYLLKAGANPNLPTTMSWNSLTFAVNAGNAAVVNELLKAGASVRLRTRAGNTSLTDDRSFEPGFKLSGETVVAELS